MKNDLTARLATTRDRAVAFVEDFRHLKEVYKNEYPDRVEIRHLSPLLRRLLLDGDLGAVAAPRVGKFSISAFDLRSFYHAPNRRFFSCGPKNIYSNDVCLFEAFGSLPSTALSIGWSNNPPPMTQLPLDKFISQDVLCFDGMWVSRIDILKYIAFFGSGIHSPPPKNDVDLLIKRIRLNVGISNDGTGFGISINPSIHLEKRPVPDPPLSELETKDVVLLETSVTAYLLAQSPDLQKLEENIVFEIENTP